MVFPEQFGHDLNSPLLLMMLNRRVFPQSSQRRPVPGRLFAEGMGLTVELMSFQSPDGWQFTLGVESDDVHRAGPC